MSENSPITGRGMLLTLNPPQENPGWVQCVNQDGAKVFILLTIGNNQN